MEKKAVRWEPQELEVCGVEGQLLDRPSEVLLTELQLALNINEPTHLLR